MTLIRMGGRGLLAFLLILSLGAAGFAATEAQIAQKTGLSPDLFVQLTVPVGGEDLGIFIVYITERTFNSHISPTLRNELLPYVGRNALYVNPSVKGVVDAFDFSPDRFTITQGETVFTPTRDDWVEITPGFLTGRFVTNPGGPSYGSGSEGILILGDRIDPKKRFTVSYQGVSGTFDLAASPAAAAPQSSAPAPSVPQASEIVPPTTMPDLTSGLTGGDFSQEAVAGLLGIDRNLVGTLVITARGEELQIILIRLEEGVRNSMLGKELLESIDPLIGTGAVMVWVRSPTGADFSPWRFFVQQNGTNYVFFSPTSFVALTPGFLDTKRVEPGTIAAGVIKLPKGVKRDVAFSVYYGTSKVDFAPLP